MSALITVVSLLIAISFVCSLLESVVLSVPVIHIQTLIDNKHRSGLLLQRLKQNINLPITSILILNTISNTAGAAIAGSLALQQFGNRWLALFSSVLTFLILVFAEIIPKTLGANMWKNIAPFSAYVLSAMVILLKPLVIPLNWFANLLVRGESAQNITREDVMSSLRLGRIHGAVDKPEFTMVNNLLKLKDVMIKDIFTPRTVVFALSPRDSVDDAMKNVNIHTFSRIPLIESDEGGVCGVVFRRKIILAAVENKGSTPLETLAHTPVYVPESLSVYALLDKLITKRTHLAVVINEFGDYNGIVTLEDALESLLGREIVDESDAVVDMRELARRQMQQRFNLPGKPLDSDAHESQKS
jgi:CBS domain containing-hemolysin-like protein